MFNEDQPKESSKGIGQIIAMIADLQKLATENLGSSIDIKNILFGAFPITEDKKEDSLAGGLIASIMHRLKVLHEKMRRTYENLQEVKSQLT